jgi:hypothetical protein
MPMPSYGLLGYFLGFAKLFFSIFAHKGVSMSLDRDCIVTLAGNWLLDMEDQGDDLNKCYFHPSELCKFSYADEIFPALYQDQNMLLDFFNEPVKRRKSTSEYMDDGIFEMFYDYLLNMTLYFVIASACGKQISKIKNLDSHEDYYKKTAQLILSNKNIIFSSEVLYLIKSVILERAADYSHTPEVQTMCIAFFAATTDENKSLEVLSKLERTDYESLYLMYRIIYHRNHPKMDIDDFLDRFIPLKLLDQAIPSLGKDKLYQKIPAILITRLTMHLSPQERMETLNCLQHPGGSLLGDFLVSGESLAKENHVRIIRHLYQHITEIHDTGFVCFGTMMIALYAFRGSYRNIIDTFSSEEKTHLINECGKFLATLRNLVQRRPDQIAYDFAIISAYRTACFLRDTVSLWKAEKPLILALRMSKKTWVDSNLYTDTNYGTMYKNLASIIVLLFDMEDEYKIENALKQLRREMADGLLELLKPLPDKKFNSERIKSYSPSATDRTGFDIHYTEPDPLWRYYYLLAIADLGATMDGKGHTFFSELKTISREDPSENVRQAARYAITKLEKQGPGMDAADHKQRLKEALWWLCQAHVISLGSSFDSEAALKTRVEISQLYSYHRAGTKGQSKLPEPFPV